MTESREKVPELTHPWPVSHSLVATLPPELALTPEEISQLDEPWQYLEAILAKLNELEGVAIDPSAEIASSAILEGPVWIGPETRVMHRTILKGPIYLGKGVIIGDASIIRGSYIADGAVVGEDSRVTRSLVGPRAEMHGMGLRDSVTGCNVHLAATSSTPNTRLDGDFVRSVNMHGLKVPTGRRQLGAVFGDRSSIGSAARIMPGVKVGNDSIVGPGVHLYNDLPDQHKVVLRQQLNISEI